MGGDNRLKLQTSTAHAMLQEQQRADNKKLHEMEAEPDTARMLLAQYNNNGRAPTNERLPENSTPTPQVVPRHRTEGRGKFLPISRES